ncbi:MAG: hypothetical protein FJX76_07210 [Armatimonadetes bacterium]|nr:hypothetical protein [Armatimonadota bacterium]
MTFTVPGDYSLEARANGELQGTLNNEFWALQPGNTVDELQADTIAKLKAIGGESFKMGAPTTSEEKGVRGKITGGPSTCGIGRWSGGFLSSRRASSRCG